MKLFPDANMDAVICIFEEIWQKPRFSNQCNFLKIAVTLCSKNMFQIDFKERLCAIKSMLLFLF